MDDKPFVHEAPNGFRTELDIEGLMRELHGHNTSCRLIALLFSKGIIEAQEVLDILHANEQYRTQS